MTYRPKQPTAKMDADSKAALEMYLAGKSVKSIAAKLVCTRSWVYELINYRIEISGGGANGTNETLKQQVYLRRRKREEKRNGPSPGEIAPDGPGR